MKLHRYDLHHLDNYLLGLYSLTNPFIGVNTEHLTLSDKSSMFLNSDFKTKYASPRIPLYSELISLKNLIDNYDTTKQFYCSNIFETICGCEATSSIDEPKVLHKIHNGTQTEFKPSRELLHHHAPYLTLELLAKRFISEGNDIDLAFYMTDLHDHAHSASFSIYGVNSINLNNLYQDEVLYPNFEMNLIYEYYNKT